VIKKECNYKISLDLAAVIKSYIKGRVLDIGTGDGSKLAFILEDSRFKEAIALEPDSAKIASAGKLFRVDSRVELINTDLENLPQNIGQFDVITMFEVIEHLPLSELDRYIRKIKELLIDGGVIIISSPNRCIYRLICNIGLDSPEPTHLSEMNWLELRRVMKRYFTEQIFKGVLPGMNIARRGPLLYGLFSILNKNFSNLAISRALYWIGKK